MGADRVLSPSELLAAEAVAAAEMMNQMIGLLHQDATDLASTALLRALVAMPGDAYPDAMSTASSLIDLAAKIAAMRIQMAPLLADIEIKEALAQRERREALAH